MKSVVAAAARSLSIIINLRLARSTSTPTMGLSTTIGSVKKKPTSVSDVAFPVTSQAHSVRPKLLTAVPSSERICPIQMTRKAVIPVGRLEDVSVVINAPCGCDSQIALWWLKRADYICI